MKNGKICGLALILLLLSTASLADEVRIVEVRVECPGSCNFSVTLEHADQGWSHYANQWDVLTLDDKLLGSRVLHHPHDNEQPFTRSLDGVKVPGGTTQVQVQARDLPAGWNAGTTIVDLR